MLHFTFDPMGIIEKAYNSTEDAEVNILNIPNYLEYMGPKLCQVLVIGDNGKCHCFQ